MLFADHGLSTAAISALYILWSSTGIVLQLPTGVLADHVSRRLLLVIAGFLRVVGFGAWIVVPSFAGFAAGFVLWGLSSALQDGTFEALVYDELAAVGATGAYGRLTARSGTGGLIASAVATALAVPLFHIGGFELVGWVSVAVCAVEGFVSLSLPARPRVAEASEGLRGYVDTLRTGIVEAATRPSVRGVVLLVALLPGLTAIDEYVPLVGRDYHVPTSVVPVFLLVITLTAAIGNWAAGRWWSLRGSRIAATLAIGAAALAASGLTDHAAGFTGSGRRVRRRAIRHHRRRDPAAARDQRSRARDGHVGRRCGCRRVRDHRIRGERGDRPMASGHRVAGDVRGAAVRAGRLHAALAALSGIGDDGRRLRGLMARPRMLASRSRRPITTKRRTASGTGR